MKDATAAGRRGGVAAGARPGPDRRAWTAAASADAGPARAAAAAGLGACSDRPDPDRTKGPDPLVALADAARADAALAAAAIAANPDLTARVDPLRRPGPSTRPRWTPRWCGSAERRAARPRQPRHGAVRRHRLRGPAVAPDRHLADGEPGPGAGGRRRVAARGRAAGAGPAGGAGRPGRVGRGVLRDVRGGAGVSVAARGGGDERRVAAGRRGGRRAAGRPGAPSTPRSGATPSPSRSSPPAQVATARTDATAHRELRGRVEATLTQLGQRPVSAQPAYATPQPVSTRRPRPGCWSPPRPTPRRRGAPCWNAAPTARCGEPASTRSPTRRPAAPAGARSSEPNPPSRSSPAAPDPSPGSRMPSSMVGAAPA